MVILARGHFLRIWLMIILLIISLIGMLAAFIYRVLVNDEIDDKSMNRWISKLEDLDYVRNNFESVGHLDIN